MVEIGRQDSDSPESCRFVGLLFAGLGYHSLCSTERVEPFLFLRVHIGGAPLLRLRLFPKFSIRAVKPSPILAMASCAWRREGLWVRGRCGHSGPGESCALHPDFVAMTICRAFLAHPVRKSVAAPFLLSDSRLEEFIDAK